MTSFNEVRKALVKAKFPKLLRVGVLRRQATLFQDTASPVTEHDAAIAASIIDKNNRLARIDCRLAKFAGRFPRFFFTCGNSGGLHARTFIKELLTNEPTKNMERMAEAVEGTKWQSVQQFIRDAKWNESVQGNEVAACVGARLGGHCVPDSDESAEGKQGRSSAHIAGRTKYSFCPPPQHHRVD